MSSGNFPSDVEVIRRKAREHLSFGAVTHNYQGQVERTIALLNQAVATEIVCVLRYKYHAVAATGISSAAVKAELAQHAKEEEEHLSAALGECRPLSRRGKGYFVATAHAL